MDPVYYVRCDPSREFLTEPEGGMKEGGQTDRQRERPPVSTDKEDERLPKDDRRIDTGGRGQKSSPVFDGGLH